MMLSSREDGLSLLELLVVIALIAIIGGLAAPNIVTWADRTVPERDMAQIKYMIDYAKRQSVAQSKTYFLKSTSQNKYYVLQKNAQFMLRSAPRAPPAAPARTELHRPAAAASDELPMPDDGMDQLVPLTGGFADTSSSATGVSSATPSSSLVAAASYVIGISSSATA